MFHEPLTTREEEVIALLADGLSTEAMAAKLFIARTTVRNHANRILMKLGAHSRLEAVAMWRTERAVGSQAIDFITAQGVPLTGQQQAGLREVFAPPPAEQLLWWAASQGIELNDVQVTRLHAVFA